MQMKKIDEIITDNLFFNNLVYIDRKVTNEEEREKILESTKTKSHSDLDKVSLADNASTEYNLIQYYSSLTSDQLASNKKATIMKEALSTIENNGEDLENEVKKIEIIFNNLIPSDVVIVFPYTGISGNFIEKDFFSIVYTETGTGINLGSYLPKIIVEKMFKVGKNREGDYNE